MDSTSSTQFVSARVINTKGNDCSLFFVSMTNSSSLRAHLIRSNKPCWCFNNATHELSKVICYKPSRINIFIIIIKIYALQIMIIQGRAFSKYVAEITILPTIPILKPHLPPLKPLFSNEDGEAFVRKCASVWKVRSSL